MIQFEAYMECGGKLTFYDTSVKGYEDYLLLYYYMQDLNRYPGYIPIPVDFLPDFSHKKALLNTSSYEVLSDMMDAFHYSAS